MFLDRTIAQLSALASSPNGDSLALRYYSDLLLCNDPVLFATIWYCAEMKWKLAGDMFEQLGQVFIIRAEVFLL